VSVTAVKTVFATQLNSPAIYHMSTWMMALWFSVCVTALLPMLAWMMQPKRSAQYYAAMRLLQEPDQVFTPFAWFQSPQDVCIGIALFMLVVSIVQTVKSYVIVFVCSNVQRVMSGMVKRT